MSSILYIDAEKNWKNVRANKLKDGDYEIFFTRTDNKIIAIKVEATLEGDVNLVRALEMAEKHRNCECEIGKYKEHREFRRKSNVSTTKKN